MFSSLNSNNSFSIEKSSNLSFRTEEGIADGDYKLDNVFSKIDC